MSDYGLMITGKPAPNEAAMLLEVIRPQIGSSGTYHLPTLPPEQVGKYRHEVTLIKSILDVSETEAFGDPFSGLGAQPRVQAIVHSEQVSWSTVTFSSSLHVVQSVSAILVWRYKID